MSKAFTSEETADEPVVLGPSTRRSPTQARPITAEGHAALVTANRALDTEFEALSALPEHERRAAKARLDHRRALLTAALASARIVEGSGDVSSVRFGHWVTLSVGGRTRRVRLVGVDEADAAKGLVSVESPLGRALLELRVGDSFELERPQGVDEGEVVRIEPA